MESVVSKLSDWDSVDNPLSSLNPQQLEVVSSLSAAIRWEYILIVKIEEGGTSIDIFFLLFFITLNQNKWEIKQSSISYLLHSD